MATGRSDYPNQVNNVLCFPFLFRGALDVGATAINQEMKIACVDAIAGIAYLQSLDWSISDIAQEVGYKSEGAFIHAFKRQMNTSPGRFRRLTRAQNTSM